MKFAKKSTKTPLGLAKSHYSESKLTSELILNESSLGLNEEESNANVNHHRRNHRNLNHKSQNNHVFDIKPNGFLIIPSKSLNSLDTLPKKRISEVSRSLSSSISSNSIDSLTPNCSNFNDTDLTLLDPTQTSTPILVRNQTNRKHPSSNSKSTKHKQHSKTNKSSSEDLGVKSSFNRFSAALINQKSFLKKTQDMLIQHKEDIVAERDETSLNKSIEKSSPVSEGSLDSSLSSSMSSIIINASSGTVRGTTNHVRASIKQVFERSSETHATNPVLNAQLNNVSIYSLHESSNYDILNDSIDQSYNTQGAKAAAASAHVARKFSETNQAYNFLARNYEIEECRKIVIYTTSVQIVRLSYDKCRRVKKILQNIGVRFIEKDLYKQRNFQKELRYRLNLGDIDVPHVFYNGRLVGNCDQLELYSDQGLLHKLFKDVEKIKLRIYCEKCGGYRYVLCSVCNGSKKKFNNFTNLKCTNCSEDALVRCDECLDQQE